MADNLSNYLENALLNHTVGKTSFTMPATVACALFTSTATVAELEAGTLTNEVTGGAYARVTVPAASWNAASGGSITTNADISFTAASASWGTIRYAALMDATTAGNVLWHGQLTADKTVSSGDIFRIAAGQITLTLS